MPGRRFPKRLTTSTADAAAGFGGELVKEIEVIDAFGRGADHFVDNLDPKGDEQA